MNIGTAVAFPANHSIFVVVKGEAETTFVPFAKTSQLVPFHFTAILVVVVVVIYNTDSVPAILFRNTDKLVTPGIMKIALVFKVDVSPTPIYITLSRV